MANKRTIQNLAKDIARTALTKYQKGVQLREKTFSESDSAAMVAAHEKRMRKRQKLITKKDEI